VVRLESIAERARFDRAANESIVLLDESIVLLGKSIMLLGESIILLGESIVSLDDDWGALLVLHGLARARRRRA
jgi:hypothetical protein